MQFHLWSLLAAITYLSVIFALIFAAPVYVAWPVLALILLASPAVWIAGIIYGHDAWRAFFIGGTIAGIVPFAATSVLALYWVAYASTVMPGFYPIYTSGSEVEPTPEERREQHWQEIKVSCALVSSGVVSGLGGIASVIVFWRFHSMKKSTSTQVPAADYPVSEDYVLMKRRIRSPLKPPAETTS